MVYYFLQTKADGNAFPTSSNKWIDDYATPLTLIVGNGEMWFAHKEQVRYPIEYQNLNRIHFKRQYLENSTNLEITRSTVYYVANETNSTFNPETVREKSSSRVGRVFALVICGLGCAFLITLMVVLLLLMMKQMCGKKKVIKEKAKEEKTESEDKEESNVSEGALTIETR